MALLASYPNIACYAASIQDLVGKLSQKEDSILEVDVANETVRLREGWEKVQICSSFSKYYNVPSLLLPYLLLECLFSIEIRVIVTLMSVYYSMESFWP